MAISFKLTSELSSDDRLTILERARRGETYPYIAKVIGSEAGVVARFARKNGVYKVLNAPTVLAKGFGAVSLPSF